MVKRLYSAYGQVFELPSKNPNIGRFLKRLREDLKIKSHGHVTNKKAMIYHLESVLQACPNLILLPGKLSNDFKENLCGNPLKSNIIVGSIYELCINHLKKKYLDLTGIDELDFSQLEIESVKLSEINKEQIQLLRLYFYFEENAPRGPNWTKIRNDFIHSVEIGKDPYLVFESIMKMN